MGSKLPAVTVGKAVRTTTPRRAGRKSVKATSPWLRTSNLFTQKSTQTFGLIEKNWADLCKTLLVLSYPQSLNRAQSVKLHSAAALPGPERRKPPEVVGAILTIIRHLKETARRSSSVPSLPFFPLKHVKTDVRNEIHHSET